MTEKKVWRCALTGHRELPPDFDDNALYDKLEEFAREGCDAFYCGMARGFDLRSLKCLVDLKKKYKFSIEACIPYLGQEKKFPASERELYQELLQFCDFKSVLFDHYCKGCFLVRDRYMVDSSDALLAYCKRETGGTAYTVNYARRKGKPVFLI